jgi:hypothetical protein
MSITAHPSDKSRHFSKEILALLSGKGNKVLKLTATLLQSVRWLWLDGGWLTGSFS